MIFFREKYGDYFGIGVAGYPEAHPDVIVDDAEKMKTNYWGDIEYLKKKVLDDDADDVPNDMTPCDQVEAGAQFVITQLFYDVDLFLQFVKDCRSVGITVPILPGATHRHAMYIFNKHTTLRNHAHCDGWWI